MRKPPMRAVASTWNHNYAFSGGLVAEIECLNLLTRKLFNLESKPHGNRVDGEGKVYQSAPVTVVRVFILSPYKYPLIGRDPTRGRYN